MKDIAIYGAGGFGREIACLINIINKNTPQWSFIGYFDDNIKEGTKYEFGSVIGNIDILNKWEKPLSVIIAIGAPAILKKVFGMINNTNIIYPNLYAPDTKIMCEENFNLGKGNVFCLGCTITCGVTIGDFNTFNGYITVGHDAFIGNYNSFMPGVRISGNVEIGDLNLFGLNAGVLQGIKIGNETVVGAGSIIIRKTKDNNTCIGNPATIVKY